MAVFSTPYLEPDEDEVLGLIETMRAELRDRVAEPQRWSGTLRKLSFARAVQGSNSIEGYEAPLDDVVAAVDGDASLDASADTQLAVSGYRDAMTYVLQVAGDREAPIDEGLLKSLHFMMLKHEMSKNPGRWRRGDIFVHDGASGAVVYRGPDADEVPALISEMFSELGLGEAPLVGAAMAHLNLVLIHPFADGNGRMARALQTLLLARDEIVAPLFSSIEEYLGANTRAYYDVLAEVGGGSWQPDNDARPWLRFCLRAHYQQARTYIRRREETERLWLACLDLAEGSGLPERCAAGLLDAGFGLRIRRRGYRAAVESVTGESISDLTASRDLKAMVDAGLLQPVGERRARHYRPGPPLLALAAELRADRSAVAEDPFALVRAS